MMNVQMSIKQHNSVVLCHSIIGAVLNIFGACYASNIAGMGSIHTSLPKFRPPISISKFSFYHFKNPQNYPKILRELSRPTKHKHCISTILNSPKITKIHHNIHSNPKQTLSITAFSRTQLIFQKITYKTHYQNPENHVALSLSVPT